MSVESFKAAGTKAFAEGHPQAAIANFTDAIKLMEKETLEKNKDKTESDEKFVHPQAAALYSNRSMCFAHVDKYLEALIDAELCIKNKPDWWKAHTRKAAAMEGLSRYVEAESCLKEALRLDPGNAEVTTKLKNISAVVVKQQREKAKPAAVKAPVALPSPKIVGDWHETANNMSALPPPTRGSRAGKKLSIRPSILDFAPADTKIKNAPMFFPAAPEWPRDTNKFMNEFLAGATDIYGRAPPLHETRVLVDIAANAYLNQKNADDAYRKSNNIKPTCDYCSVSLTMPSPPSCECGEFYCSRQCMELNWNDHKKICETIRSQSTTLPMFHRMYWEGCGYGELSWVGQRVKNYSVQYHELVKEKKRKERESASSKLAAAVLLGGDASSTTTTTSAASSVCGNPPVPTSSTASSSSSLAKKKKNKAEDGFAPELDENDVEDLDEFSYLMLHERTAVVRVCTDLQAISQKATAEGDLRTQNVAISDLCAALIELYLRYSYHDKKKDSVQRVQFKIAMLEMLMTVLMQFKLAHHVEPLDISTSRFEDVIKSASAKDAASPEALSKFIEANGPSATTFSNEVLAAMKESM